MHTIIIHIPNDEPVVGEVEELPSPTDVTISVNNPRRRDGKDVHYLQSNVMTVIWPFNQIAFVEILPSTSDEKIISFVKE